MLTIVVPTFNRHSFLSRLLVYEASVNCPYPILIGDSSSPEEFTKTAHLVERYRKKLNLLHQAFPGKQGCQTHHLLLEMVSTPYVVYLADDDFFIPTALGRVVEFLEGHPDYSMAHGRGALIKVVLNGENRRIDWAQAYGQPSLEQTRARERLSTLRWGTAFSVNRTAAIRSAFQEAISLGLDPKFCELLTNCFMTLRGKSKRLDSFYMVRQIHPKQDSLKYGQNDDALDWMINPKWAGQYGNFRASLASELARQDGLKDEEALEIVHHIFASYLTRLLVTKSRYMQHPRGFLATVRERVRFLPGFRSTWHRVQAFLPGMASTCSLPALLRSSSPFHSDFMSVYQAITTDHVHGS